MKAPTIYVLSDSIGETAENIARAAVSQYDQENVEIIRIPYVRTVEQIEEILEEVVQRSGIICYTLVTGEVRDKLSQLTIEKNIIAVDLMGPILKAVGTITQTHPRMRPGMVHKLDQDYFERVAAIEFAVKYDDGKNPSGFLKADIVIIGVSRTSKTPLSMYLAHKRVKAANLPLVPEVPLPDELFQIPSHKIVGLIIDPYKLNSIRTERLRTMGLNSDANYAALNRIAEELDYAKAIMRKLHCPIIDVSAKAIEETTNRILEIVGRNKELDR